MKKIPVGVLGATGIVGQRFIQMLEFHPWFEVAWLAASDRSEGREYSDAARWRLKTPIPASVAKMRVSAAAPRTALRRGRLCGNFELQRAAHGERCSVGHARGQSGPREAD